jgi:thioredoxin 2
MSDAKHLTADDRGVILFCPQCQRANRIPYSRLAQAGRCGTCQALLPFPNLPVSIESTASFSALVRASSLPVFIDFWAAWCGPCKTVALEVEKLAANTTGELLVAKVNTEEQSEISVSLNIRAIPTFVLLVAGREVDRMSGAVSARELQAFTQRTRPPTKAVS